jgi:hypothetical protein
MGTDVTAGAADECRARGQDARGARGGGRVDDVVEEVAREAEGVVVAEKDVDEAAVTGGAGALVEEDGGEVRKWE